MAIEEREVFAVGRDGEVARARGLDLARLETDRLRFEVVAAGEDVGGFQVLVFVDDVEMTAAGAGLGMDPYDVFVPDNRLVATTEPHRVPIARCECGVYGCGSTDVTIVRAEESVHWDWELEKPMARGVTFPAGAYDAAVEDLVRDRSWETPERRSGRLVLERADHDALASNGLELQWVGKDHRDARRFQASLGRATDYQVFVSVPWDDQSPDEVAEAMVAELKRPPREWAAAWHPVHSSLTEPPPFAGRQWRRFVI